MGFWRKNDKPIITVNGVDRSDIVLHTVANFSGITRREPMAIFELANVGNSPNTTATNPNASEFASGSPVSIKVRDRNGGFRTIHIGRIRAKSISSSSTGEAVVYESRFDDSFADVIGSPQLEWRQSPFWNEEPFSAYVPQIVFNPIIQDEVYGNRFGKKLILPQSMELSKPSKYNKWKLWEAVTWLVSYLVDPNAALPGLVQQVDVTAIDRNLEVETLVLDAGMSLAECLNKMLSPYGYGWYYEFVFHNTAKIYVHKTSGNAINGVRYYSNFYKTPINDKIDIVDSFEIHENEFETFGQVTIAGDSRLVELTDSLVPGWDRSLDETPSKDLVWDSEAMQSDDRLRDVWRKWVPEHPELESKYDGGNSKESKKFRRPFMPTLTVDKSNRPIGAFRGVHFSFTDSSRENKTEKLPLMRADGEPGLQGCGNLEILKDEGAVRFIGREPPMVLKKYGYKGPARSDSIVTLNRNIKLFVTCCIDTYKYQADPTLDGNLIYSVTGYPSKLQYVVHAPQRFQHVTYIDSDELKSEFADRKSPEVKCKNIRPTLERILDSAALKTIEGRISYHGLDNVSVANLIGKSMLYCRQRKLARGLDRYPVVVGYSLNFDNQTTAVQIGSYRD